MKVQSIVIGLLSLVAAGATAAKTTALVFAQSRPQLALSVDPSNPIASARLGSLLVARPKPDAEALDTVRALSLRALRSTPGNVTALRTLGIVEARTRPGRGGDMVRLAASFAKRDTAAQLWLIQYYARTGDDDRALDSLGAALRTSPSVRPLLFPALLQSVAQPALHPQIADLLTKGTEWPAEFWNYLQDSPTLPAHIGGLVAAVGSRGGELPKMAMETIASRLASDGRIAEALTLVSAIDPTADIRKAFVGLQDFFAERLPAPFGWDLASTGRLFGEAGDRGELHTDVRTGSQGVIARRLVALSTEGATLTARLAVEDGSVEDAPAILVRCADSDRVLLDRRPTARIASIIAPITVSGDCPYQWIEIVSPEVRSAEGASATFSQVSLHPGTAR